jgi:hypothetical protein
MNPDDVLEVWTGLLANGVAGQRSLEKHPLKLYFGCDDVARPIFFLRTTVRPDLKIFSSVVSVEVRERPEHSEWTVLLTVNVSDYNNAFMALCVELMRRSSNANSESESLAEFYEALHNFRNLFALGGSRNLSLEEERGLVGELWFLSRVLAPTFGHNQSVEMWKGPYGAPQDFRTPTGFLIELKAIHSQSRTVTISSPEQLDPGEDVLMHLATVTVDETFSGSPEASSVSNLIAEIQKQLRGNSESMLAFEDRLKSLNVLDSFALYDSMFAVSGPNVYEVSDGFPRIRSASVPLEVEGLKYKLSLKSIVRFATHLRLA